MESSYRKQKFKNYAMCTSNEYSYVRRGKFYEVTSLTDTRIAVIDCEGDSNTYDRQNFTEVKNSDFAANDVVKISKTGNIGTIGKVLIEEDYISYRVDFPGSDWHYYKSNELTRLIGPESYKVGDKLISNRDYAGLRKGNTYEVLDMKDYSTRGCMVKVCIYGTTEKWVRDVYFDSSSKKEEVKDVKNEVKEEKENNKNKSEVANMTNTFADKLGVFGAVTGAALTMTGRLAFMGADNNYYSYEDGVLVNNEQMIIEGMPTIAMPVPRHTLKSGDLIIQKNGDFLFVDEANKFINEKGEVITVVASKHMLFGNSFDFVSKVMDFGFNMGNIDMDNPLGNPMMLMAMMGGKKSDSDDNDMMSMFMMMSAMGGNIGNAGGINPMMLMALSGKGNDSMKSLVLASMFANQQQPQVQAKPKRTYTKRKTQPKRPYTKRKPKVEAK